MGRVSDSHFEGASKGPAPHLSLQIKQALTWFYGLTEEERIAEWNDWEKRQRRFMRDHMSADYVQFCIQPAKYIHAQWIHRQQPML